MDLCQLLRECQRNSLVAQRKLYDLQAGSMFLLCRRYMKNDETAEEVMMNGFLKFFRGLAGFQYVNEAATIGWLRRIMVNECLMELRKTQSFLQLTGEELPEAADNSDLFDQMEAAEIFRLITRLPPGYRTVFNLYVVEELSHKEIAALLGISEGTSRSQLNKARGMLQQIILQQNGHGRRKTK